MSKKGCSSDNSACEGLFSRPKNEFFCCRNWPEILTGEFMERFEARLCYHNEATSRSRSAG